MKYKAEYSEISDAFIVIDENRDILTYNCTEVQANRIALRLNSNIALLAVCEATLEFLSKSS